MDRDSRWDRTENAFAAVVRGRGTPTHTQRLLRCVQESYDAGVTDEFVEPIVNEDAPRLSENDAAVFFNFRPDRGRQLARLLLERGFDLTTMTRYSDDLDCPVVFEDVKVEDTLAQVLSRAGVRQLHVAETEKYAHVTYFFNGGREQEWPGGTRVPLSSPR